MRDVITAPRPGLDFRKHYGHHQSPAIRAGGLIFCSGMLPIDPQTGERRHGTLTSEAHVIFGNLKLLLESAGSSLDHVIKAQVFLTDLDDFHGFDTVWKRFFKVPPPRTTIGCTGLLVKDTLVEIDLIGTKK